MQEQDCVGSGYVVEEGLSWRSVKLVGKQKKALKRKDR